MIANNPPPHPGQPIFQQKTYPETRVTKTSTKTHLIPVTTESQEDNHSTTKQQDELRDETKYKTEEDEKDDLQRIDQPVKSEPDLMVTLVPVISVCAIFLTVGIIAMLFRKKICLGRVKESKEDMVSLNYFMIIFIYLFFHYTYYFYFCEKFIT